MLKGGYRSGSVSFPPLNRETYHTKGNKIMRPDFQIQFLPLDFTITLPRILGHASSFSVVHGPRAPHEPAFYLQRVPRGLEVRIGSRLLYAESAPQRR